jgi:hypothetical protein
VKSPDLCTDPGCFHSKLDAVWKLRVKESKKTGVEVLEGKAADKALGYGGSHKKLDDEEWIGTKRKTVRQLLGKNLPELALARDSEGNIHQVVRTSDVKKAIAAATKTQPGKEDAAEQSWQARQRLQETKLKRRRKAITLAIAAAVDNADAGKLAPIDVLELVVRAFAARSWNEVQTGLLERRGIQAKGGGGGGNVETRILKLCKDVQTNGETMGIGLELAMRSGSPWGTHAPGAGVSEIWRDALKLAGVDFAKLEKQVADEERAKKKAKGAKGAKGKGKTAKAKVKATKAGTCSVCGCTEQNACEGPLGEGCYWVDSAKTLCSECAGKAKAAADIGLPKELVAPAKKSGKTKAAKKPGKR